MSGTLTDLAATYGSLHESITTYAASLLTVHAFKKLRALSLRSEYTATL